VPETGVMSGDELSAEDAWHTLRRYGRWPLVRDSFLRFRYGDGFSHARALGLQLSLAAVPFLIAMSGLITQLGGKGGRVIADTVLALTPGASKSLVNDLLVDDHTTRTVGRAALALGLVIATIAWATAVGQIERGANRIYGVERDRPAAAKYGRALVLGLVAGLPAVLGFLMLVAGGPLSTSLQRWYGWGSTATTTWLVARWPVGIGLTVVAVATLFRYAPRRHQPNLSWLAVGAGLGTVLWTLTSVLLAVAIQLSGSFNGTYGPLTGFMALLLWANLTGIALFLGIAFAAQLEACRAGVREPVMTDRWQPLDERPEPDPAWRHGAVTA
jgi:YihY family inner membrane protein